MTGRDAVVAESAPRGFAANCPRGHRPAQTLSISDLNRPGVEFYCVLCDLWWTPAPEERDRALSVVTAASRDTTAPISPAVAVVQFTCESCGSETYVHCQCQTDPTGCSDGVVECLDCGYANRPVLPGPILDVFRA